MNIVLGHPKEHSHSEPVFCPLSNEGFQAWLGNRKLSSHQPAVFFDHAQEQNHPQLAFFSLSLSSLLRPTQLTGMFVPLLFKVAKQ
jgi:hypothetical protein